MLVIPGLICKEQRRDEAIQDLRLGQRSSIPDTFSDSRGLANDPASRPTAQEPVQGASDPKELQVAIGHVPLSEAGFRDWEPVLVMEQEVTEAELEGYRIWKEQ